MKNDNKKANREIMSTTVTDDDQKPPAMSDQTRRLMADIRGERARIPDTSRKVQTG